ncbi:hypothetical protein QBC33DRAFT_548529 [Phialemonium atrogriseum]|uniref:Uncharacterized protein n=1 Tax=Phialemonium atrogriseum TaxID=1093897 RepID=A0AAJ0BU34_9PEZI|nr:uncharacterized protein QBC33DRAFT_548529 [Phialemonium atrogriseum]KAK1764012.1 hypothetical protein QBC33DRAFT_548529 [Phialemonium atrogriseum]
MKTSNIMSKKPSRARFFPLRIRSPFHRRSGSSEGRAASPAATATRTASQSPPTPSPLPSATAPSSSTPAPLPPPDRDLWVEAIEQASDKAKKWMIANGCYGKPDPRSAKVKIQELVKIAKKRESRYSDHPLAIRIGTQKIIFGDYVADFVRCLTMVGDAVIPFAPSEVSAPWSVVKAVMQGRCIHLLVFCCFIRIKTAIAFFG